jgi:hypothetical protein
MLERLVDAYKQDIYENGSTIIVRLRRNNATSATILFTFETSGNGSFGISATFSVNDTMCSFPATQDVTNFLNAFDKTNYGLRSTFYASNPASNVYYNAKEYFPIVYKAYSYTEGTSLGGSRTRMQPHSITTSYNLNVAKVPDLIAPLVFLFFSFVISESRAANEMLPIDVGPSVSC